MSQLVTLLLYVVGIGGMFLLLIAPHEGGHFLFAKLFKVRVIEFSVGAGTVHLGPIPSTPAVGALMWSVGLILAAGAAAIVVALAWFANSRLRAYEGTIATV